MLTRDERRALLFLAAVSVAGAVARAAGSARSARARGAGGAGAVIAPHLAGGDLVAQAARSRRAEAAQRPLEPGEKVDVEHATAEELARLPRIGSRLAQRIVADRRDRGPFGTLAGLARVPGLTPSVLGALAPYATFGGVPASITYTGPSPPPGPAAPATTAGTGGAACPDRIVVNQADRAGLECLPGIGPVLAERIIAERSAHGPFRDAADLSRVKGLGKLRIERLRSRVIVP